MRFGRLTVISYKGRQYWNCMCDCGNSVAVRANNLKMGTAKSCGCYHRDRVRETSTKHGEHNRPLYHVWRSMKQRCGNKNSHVYQYYGGRGISVCPEWAEYIPFRNWALANGYARGLTLDRIDTDGNYEPSNCRWVTMSVQNSNKRHYERPSLYKPVDAIGDDGLVSHFPSIKSAAESIGGNVKSNRTRIHKALRGEINKAFGMRWEYA